MSIFLNYNFPAISFTLLSTHVLFLISLLHFIFHVFLSFVFVIKVLILSVPIILVLSFWLLLIIRILILIQVPIVVHFLKIIFPLILVLFLSFLSRYSLFQVNFTVVNDLSHVLHHSSEPKCIQGRRLGSSIFV